MTSVSLFQSRRWPERRITEFARLNLTWAVGAGVGPAVLLRSSVLFGTTIVLHAAAGVLFVFALLVIWIVPAMDSPIQERSSWLRSVRSVPIILLGLIPLATGVESGVNSWLSSYVMRGGHVLIVTISATTAFGVGLIASRLFHSRRNAAEASKRIILRLHPWFIVVGILLLLLSNLPILTVLAAFLTGVGVGPMYPLVLALLLNHNEAGNSGFLAGGIGASVLPMITGEVSSWTHSLRTGLCVLLLAAILIAVLSATMQSASRSRT
jgi:fucose permease